MGLEQFMGDLGVEPEEPQEEESQEDESPEPDYTYHGDEELLDIPFKSVKQVLDETEYEFEEQRVPSDGKPLAVQSPGGKFWMVVTYPTDRYDRDCLLVGVRDTESGYNVMEPYPVYLVEGWQDELKEAINTIEDKKDELVFCERCGGIMIIRTTNRTKKRIRGCSNYPDCHNKEVLSDGT